MERSKQNKQLVSNEDNDFDNGVDNGEDDSVDDGMEDGMEDGADSADKHLAHLSQAAECCMIKRSKQNKQLVCVEDGDFDDGVDNGDNDSVDD
eukprot:8908455-Ditylum_brightwellii.AAC.1